ncbi:hybrid sensor histidine kinase/response regulator [Granulosicoccus sp. 3-233]|uniref:hybrid sensor histidine kinase/response regulator n=1 Tax=Granulosicoccus sp. 3-233 TaxID=3417969 RepID=UPI003D3335F1
MKAGPHPQEDDRLAALHGLQILDTSSEEEFDELVEMASSICNTPISLISLVDADRQWFKARTGLQAAQTSLHESVCAHAILDDQPLIISDTLLDSRTRDNPLVHNEINMRFYAGVPLKTEEDLPIGTLCVLDTVPRNLSAEQLRALQVLGRQVMTRMTLRTALQRETELKLQLEQQRDKLLCMNTKLRNADESKNLFLAMLSHELRNPLSALSNGLSLLDDSETATQTRQTVQMMHRQCSQLTRLLDDLLDVSRISRGKISLQQHTIALAPVLQDACGSMAGDAAAKQIGLELNSIPTDVHVHADAVRLQQVIVNLLHNAIRYTPSGGRIRVDTEVNASEVLIRVHDTGQGICKEDLEKVFDLFVQLENTGLPANHGLGLGLALVSELVSLHGGQVSVESDGPGCGSTFCVALPLASGPVEQDPTRSADTVATNAAALDVLVTDDNLDSISALGRLLERRQHQVRLAGSGTEALQAAREKTPDVVLLDIGLPDISGHEVARQLRSLYPARDILLIATTGYGQPEDQERSHQAGFDHHLTKPIELNELNRLMNAFRNRRSAGDTD